MDEQRRHLEELRQVHLRRLHELELKEAAFGLNAPPEIRTELADIRARLAELDGQLGRAAPRLLPAPVPDFVGREHEIDRLLHAVNQAIERNTAAICGIRAMGGCGKSQLALAVAQRLAPAFPDGQVLIELRGTSAAPLPSTQTLQTVIRAFNREARLPDDLTELQAIYQATLKGKRLLILADDAKDADQVRPLVPSSGCALFITSCPRGKAAADGRDRQRAQSRSDVDGRRDGAHDDELDAQHIRRIGRVAVEPIQGTWREQRLSNRPHKSGKGRSWPFRPHGRVLRTASV